MENRNIAIKSPVPGLSRGIRVLRVLEDGNGKSLDDIVRITGFPKSSLIRILETLEQSQLVIKDLKNKTYTGLMKFVSIHSGNDDFQSRLQRSLEKLADITEATVEWYIPTSDGLVINNRKEPKQEMIQVLAQIGFIREWNMELDSVARVGWAFAPPSSELPGFKEYAKDGVLDKMDSEKARKDIFQTRKDGYTMDYNYNINGVRRAAVPVMDGDSLIGIIALAFYYRPLADKILPDQLKTLFKEAQLLSQ